jgi:hypothetical protein
MRVERERGDGVSKEETEREEKEKHAPNQFFTVAIGISA